MKFDRKSIYLIYKKKKSKQNLSWRVFDCHKIDFFNYKFTVKYKYGKNHIKQDDWMTGWNSLLNREETNSLNRVQSSMSMIFGIRQLLFHSNLITEEVISIITFGQRVI